MLRLARSSAQSTTPHRLYIARTRLPNSLAPTSTSRETDGMQHWQPGDPINFGTRPERETPTARECSPGDPIRFGGTVADVDAKNGASVSRTGSLAKKQARTSTPSPRRPSSLSIATRATGPSSPRSASPFNRSSASWLSHRFDTPSPSPSAQSAVREDDSVDSTAYLPPTRHCGPQPNVPPHCREFPSRTGPISPTVPSAPTATSLMRSPRGATQVSQAELDELVSGVDFEEDLSSSSDIASTAAAVGHLAPKEVEALVTGIDFSDDFDATDVDDSVEILAPPEPTTSRVSPSPVPHVGVSTFKPPSGSCPFISSTSPRPHAPRPLAASPRPRVRSPTTLIDLTNSPASTSTLARNLATSSKVAMDWDEILDDEDLSFVGGEPVSSVPAAAAKSAAPGAAVPTAAPRKAHRVRTAAVTAAKENQAGAAARTRKGRPLSATALRQQASEEKDAAARAKWSKTFNFREWAPRDVQVIYSTDADEVRQVLSTMEGPFGFDLEWNIYGPPKIRRAALVQVCDRKTVLLVHVARMGTKRGGFVFPDALKEFVEDEKKIKLGVNIKGDATKLSKDFEHQPRGMLDLNTIRLRHDGETFNQRFLVSLQQLVGAYLDCYLPKDANIRCSKWHEPLSPQQLEYAANDVYSSLMILHAIHSLADLSPEKAHTDLSDLLRSPPVRTYVSSRSTPARAVGAEASSLEAAVAAFPPRRLELFDHFSNPQLSFDEVHAKMNENGSMKPISVVWNLLGMYAELRSKGVEDGLDVARLRDFVKAVEAEWSPRFLAEHGALISELRRVVPAQNKASG